MKFKKISFLIIIAILSFQLSAQNEKSKSEGVNFDNNKIVKWMNLFPKEGLGTVYSIDAEHKDSKKLFDIKNNKVKALYNWPDGKAPFGMISTVKKYSHYNVEFSYKWGERKFAPRDSVVRDAGILFHCKGVKKIWPSSLECQVQEGDTGDLWVIKGPKVTVVNRDGTKREVDASGKAKYQRNVKFANYERRGWNHVRVEVRGSESARFFVNGKLVNEIINFTSANGNPLAEGYITLQAEGAEITYKQIRIQNLK